MDVGIVGGGIAGLSVASRLLAAGVSCTVLESQDRVGGRLLSHRSAAGDLDLGASWYWPGETRVAALIDELRIATHPHYLAGDALFHLPGKVQRIDGNPIDVVSGRFSDGAASLATELAAQLGDTVSLDTAVHEVQHSTTGVEVGHAHGVLSCRHVVLALPPALAVHGIAFRPSLPERLHQLAKATPVWMGNVAKAVVVYPDAFWRRHGLSGAAISHVGPLRELHDMSGADGRPAALFGFAPLELRGVTPTRHDIVRQLVEMFGPEAAAPIEVVVKDWRLDRHTVPPDARPLSAMQTYADASYQEPAGEGRIHWASTETAPESPGHIEGALAAAERAVQAILNARPVPTRSSARAPQEGR